MPGASYTETDRNIANRFCSIDFTADSVALCPKLFSTSPGTLIYDISSGPYAGDPGGFEKDICRKGKVMAKEARGEPISFKTTMNAQTTSATFSTASLLYYHFSRYFNTLTHVPVSTWRSMDAAAHKQRVTVPGVQQSAHKHALRMNHEAWRTLLEAEQKPASYKPTAELFTPDHLQIYGILVQPRGHRYGAELNGTRESGWGEGQNRDFMETAPYLALRSEKPLKQAIATGMAHASKNTALRKAMGSHVSRAQMVFWMQELTEISLLDFIFSQQDRIGNIDYLNYWYWIEDGSVRQRKASGSTIPVDIAAYQPQKIRRTQLNDNDAGGKLQYANYAKKTGMLESIRHYSHQTYRSLMQLQEDFQRKGELFDYVSTSFGLTDKQLQQILHNTQQAADILKASCRAGKLRFDLDPKGFFATGDAREQQAECEG